MASLVVGLVFVGAIAFFSLVLSLQLARRLRIGLAVTDLTGGHRVAMPSSGLRVGAEIPEFTARPVNGEVVSRSDFVGGVTLVGFFSTGCRGCREQLPAFVDRASLFSTDLGTVFAVVSDDGGDVDAFAGELSPVARVVVESAPRASDRAETGRGVTQAFAVQIWPSFFVVGADGRVQVSTRHIDEIAMSVA